jgi:hypothetical protein
MLCDYLVADNTLHRVYDGLDKVYAKIRTAQKFVLSKEFTIAADGLMDNLPQLNKIAPYCRVPFPLTWIEWVSADRPHWNPEGPYQARPVDLKRHQSSPQRIGLLLEQDGSAARWKAHLFWSLKEKPETAESLYNGSLASVTIDTSTCGTADDVLMGAFAGYDVAEFGERLRGFLSRTRPDVFDQLAEYAVEDWGGEIRFMVATLGLLNTRNVTQVVSVDNEEHNAKRIRRGKLPLFSHKLLKVRSRLMAHNADESLDHQHRELRLHFVQGHFKHRKTGLYYWSWHARGSGKHGIIDKDYVV